MLTRVPTKKVDTVYKYGRVLHTLYSPYSYLLSTRSPIEGGGITNWYERAKHSHVSLVLQEHRPYRLLELLSMLKTILKYNTNNNTKYTKYNTKYILSI